VNWELRMRKSKCDVRAAGGQRVVQPILNSEFAILNSLPNSSSSEFRILTARRASELLCRLEMREFRAQRLLTDGVEADDQLSVAIERLDAEHAANAELWMAHPHARPQDHPR
jgi:hypothetical protein